MILLLISLFISLLLGFLFVSIFWPADNRYLSSTIKLCLGAAFGLGFSSCMLLGWLSFYKEGRGFILIEVALIALLALIYAVTKKYSKPTPASSDKPGGHKKDSSLLVVKSAFFVVLLLVLGNFIYATLKAPHGSWDAWTIWNMRARFIFRLGLGWRYAFSDLLSWSHTDYPLFIPLCIVRSWKYLNNDAAAVPAVFSLVFMLLSIGVLYSSVAVMRTRIEGFIAAITLMGTFVFLGYGPAQYADIPFGVFLLISVALLSFSENSPELNKRFIFLAGLSAGFAAWTKNEGILLFISIVLMQLIIGLPKGFKRCFNQIAIFLVGALPILGPLLYFKFQIAPFNDIFYMQSKEDMVAKIIDFSRYIQIAKAFIGQALRFLILIPMAIYLFIAGIKIKERDKAIFVQSFGILFIIIAGYFIIYLISPYSLTWHLATSVDRLLLQVWPSFIFSFFLITNNEYLMNQRG